MTGLLSRSRSRKGVRSWPAAYQDGTYYVVPGGLVLPVIRMTSDTRAAGW